MKKSILAIGIISILLLGAINAFASISENDQKMNKNIEEFIPAYTPLSGGNYAYAQNPYYGDSFFTGRTVIFEIRAENPVRVTPMPGLYENNRFLLGYTNRDTKLRLFVHKLGYLGEIGLILSVHISDFELGKGVPLGDPIPLKEGSYVREYELKHASGPFSKSKLKYKITVKVERRTSDRFIYTSDGRSGRKVAPIWWVTLKSGVRP